MDTRARLGTNSEKIISETLEGETIVINLETGTYYSMNAAASRIWADVLAGGSAEDIVRRAAERCAEKDTAAVAATEFVVRLADEGLVATVSGEPVRFDPAEAFAPLPFEAPTLDRYDDMQEMLLADPIHDVDTAGWPKRREA